MLRAIAVVTAIVLMLSCGVATASWWLRDQPATARLSMLQWKTAYNRIRAGVTPASQLSQLGFNTATATKLSYLGVVESFMAQDSFGFDALDPAVQSCIQAPDRGTGYIFALPHQPRAKVIFLIEGGRVAYKAVTGLSKMGQADRPAVRPNLRASVD